MIVINGKALSTFNARLRNREIGLSETDVYKAWADNSITPYISVYEKLKWKQLRLLIEFNGLWSNRELKKTNFHREMLRGKLTFNDEPNIEYFYVIDGAPTLKDSYPSYESVQYDLSCYKQDSIYTSKALVNGSNSLTVDQNAIVKLSLKAVTNGTSTVTINGKVITLRNMKTTVFRIIENGTVTESGVNKWTDTDLFAFPSLSKGTNTIVLNNATGTLEYKRRYI